MDLYRNSIALTIRSLDHSLFTHLQDLYRARYPLACWISTALVIHSLAGSLWEFDGSSIAVIVHSLDRSLFTRLVS